MEYIYPIIIFAALGLFAGILLTFASKAFAVKTDERIERISEVLPQVNCGACGFAGCSDYADAVVTKNAKLNMCKPGGAETSAKISAVMGKNAESFEPEVCFVHCGGDCNSTQKKFDFTGIQSCVATKRFYGGDGICSYGCIGLGDCVSVCSEGAISIKDGIAVIDKAKCIACGKCAKVCPNQLISIQPLKDQISVRCSSKDAGKITKQNCSSGCIGCKICEKKCVSEAIKVVDNHAVIDYEKCINCDQCYQACPTGAIYSCKK